MSSRVPRVKICLTLTVLFTNIEEVCVFYVCLYGCLCGVWDMYVCVGMLFAWVCVCSVDVFRICAYVMCM